MYHKKNAITLFCGACQTLEGGMEGEREGAWQGRREGGREEKVGGKEQAELLVNREFQFFKSKRVLEISCTTL